LKEGGTLNRYEIIAKNKGLVLSLIEANHVKVGVSSAGILTLFSTPKKKDTRG
jgi:hypothetical protein